MTKKVITNVSVCFSCTHIWRPSGCCVCTCSGRAWIFRRSAV